MLSKVKAAINSLHIGYTSQIPSVLLNAESDSVISDVHQQRDKNKEDITIVWLNEDTTNTKTQSFIELLRSINDYVRVFNNENAALAYIESIFEEKILLIVDHLSDNLLHALETLKQVDALFLYTSVSPDDLPPRVTALCPTEQQLIDEIKYICQQINKQMTAFSIYNHNKTDKLNLNYEVGTFLFFELFKYAFKKLPKKSESKKLMLSKYRDYYAGNRKLLEELNNFERNYKPHEALQWYINNSFIYRLVNKGLRTENINTLCYFHFYIKDLSKQLEEEFVKFKKQNSKSIINLYCAFKTTREGIKNFERNIGNLIITNGYLLTTRNRKLAFDFSMKQNIQFDEEKVLFEFTIDLTNIKSIIFADISQYNKYSDDYEILFDLGAIFKINSCKYNDKENLWLVNINGTDEGFEVTSEYIQYEESKMTDSNIILTLGHLIIEIGDYDKAEKYFDKILHSPIPNDEEISCIYYHMGRIYRLKGDYQRALEFLKQAYITHSQARPSRLASAAKAMNAIGIVYMEQHNVQQAIDSFQLALKLYAKTVQEYHPDIGGTLINLANIYCEGEQYEDALLCFKRAQNIYDCNLPYNHPNRAMLLNNIGNFYYRQHQYDLALIAYQQALGISEKILPANHPDIARNKRNLSMIHTILDDQNKSNLKNRRTSEFIRPTTGPHMESKKINLLSSKNFETNQEPKSDAEMIEMKNYSRYSV
ncbi:unnamed protein product [Rotaria sordida]|uniref:Uncharacterized protein n=1 Tax=Rotaria sordida TaxID=392033 RepID=A0A819UAJ8_9BILA|nr:unnamed protein product [Rotaria sordida]CAF4091605.1 unnamed protein product [Rotaria sordida]